MINNVTFTGMQKFMTAAAHEYLPTGKIFEKAEVKAAEKVAEEAAKSVASAVENAESASFFNHRGNNVIDTTVAELQDLEAAKSYARSHGVQIAEELAGSTIKTDA